jgi:hypothetical protein
MLIELRQAQTNSSKSCNQVRHFWLRFKLSEFKSIVLVGFLLRTFLSIAPTNPKLIPRSM